MSFRNRLLLTIIPAILFLMIGMASYLEYAAGIQLLNSQKQTMTQGAKQITEGVQLWMGHRVDQINVLAHDHAVVSVFSSDDRAHEVQSKLTKLYEVDGNYSSILLLNLDGEIIYNSVKGRSVGKAYGQREGFSKGIKGALAGKITFDDPQISPATKNPIMFITAPVYKDDKVVGIVGGVVHLAKMSEKYIVNTKYGRSGYPYIVDRNGVLVAHPNKEHILKLDISKYPWGNELLAQKTGEIEYKFGEENKFAILSYIENLEWTVAASIDYEEFYEDVIYGIVSAIIITIISIIILASITFYITNNVFVAVKNVSSGVSQGAQNILFASEELTDSSTSLSSTANQQASSVEETSASLEELTSMVENNLEGAKQTNELAAEMNEISNTANNYIVDLAQSMEKLKGSNEEVKNLVNIIKQISDKAAVIDEIVFQTKLLSFNASVEAERAGEHGRGFAVVAQEVGNLAQMSGNAAQEISEILNHSISTAQQITTDNEKNVIEGGDKVNLLDEVVKKVLESSQSVASNANDIMRASEEQHLGLKQISDAVTTLDQSIQDMSSVANKSAQSSEELKEQANHLNELIEGLNVIVCGKA